jgi:O-antigen/teichoic acid export membrane protein
LANLKKNLVYNFLLSFSQVLIPFFSIPYIARVLDPEGIGKVGFIDSLTYYFIAAAEFGIVVYGIREIARVQDDEALLRKTVSELLVLHFISSCCALLLYGITIFLCWSKIQDIRLLLFSLSFLLVNFFACEWYFWGRERFRYITIRSLITRLLGLGSIFWLVKGPGDYYLYYGIMVSAAIINWIFNIIALLREVPFTLKHINWRRHVPHTIITFLISITYCVTLMLDNVLLGLVSTTAAVGLYVFAIKIVRIGASLMTDAFLVLYPRTVSLMQQQNKEAVQQTILKSVQLITLLAIPAGMGMFLLADPLVKVFLSNKFYSVSDNLKLIALLPFIKAYGVFLSKQVLIPNNYEKLYLRSLIAGSLLFVGFTLVLSYYFQDKGACIAIMLAEIVVLLFNYKYARRVAPTLLLFDWRTGFHALLGALLFIPVILLLKSIVSTPGMMLLLSVLICIPLYFLFQLLVFRNTLVRSVYQAGWGFIRS